MLVIEGKMNVAKVFASTIEDAAKEQIKLLCDQEFTKDLQIRIMPDVHAGAGCTIGTTMTLKDKIVPNLVGVDIGCGMHTIQIKNKHLELEKVDKVIHEKIPTGFRIREEEHRYSEEIDLTKLRCLKEGKINVLRAAKSIGTLGGGNHFIEVAKDAENKHYVVVHSGSRHLGLEVAGFYQEEAYRQLDDSERQRIPKALAYAKGKLMEDYVHDMKIVQEFATLNRRAMMDEIIKGLKLKVEEEFTTIHNYIDTKQNILRKGAVSAREGEKLLIPINMRDGSLICIGKGNIDWNQSAPHGAGRLMSRKEARNSFTVSEFKKQMKDIYTTSVNAETLDECPMAYKDIKDIVENIKDTAKIIKIIKPIYNFKAAE